jgi:hypothetical protein
VIEIAGRGRWRADRTLLVDAAGAGAVAALASGIPSTLHSLWTRTSVLEGTLAAGTLLLHDESRPSRLIPAAAVAHLSLSFGWALVLAASLPQRHRLSWATAAGLGIAGLDLGVIGRRFFPRIRALPLAPQVADHLAYAWTVALVLNRRRASGCGRTRARGAMT